MTSGPLSWFPWEPVIPFLRLRDLARLLCVARAFEPLIADSTCRATLQSELGLCHLTQHPGTITLHHSATHAVSLPSPAGKRILATLGPLTRGSEYILRRE